ncbi:MAG: DUF6468 domain-containing protein [Hyphomonadaceae bacterium]|jgi:hypothetical protein|nr:DUF6468 domain-containing protein [Hyphomonadaceae bacterium]
MSEQLMSLAAPVLQGFLALALVLVAVMLVRVDRKLSALKSGRDGMAAATVELMAACAKAEAAVKALKDGESAAQSALDGKLQEARALAETLKFLSTTARAVAGDAATSPSRLPWKQSDRTDDPRSARPALIRDHAQPADSLPRSPKVRALSREPVESRDGGGRFDWSGLR